MGCSNEALVAAGRTIPDRSRPVKRTVQLVVKDLGEADLELRSFRAADIPPYIILSHRWTDDEISFEDFANLEKQKTAGYLKIKQLCNFLVRKRERSRVVDKRNIFEPTWVWVDTCCIDKRSSSELSEAINSMAQWYANADYCIVYLADLHDIYGDMEHCVWFKRGWTLQELLLPKKMLFCDRNWYMYGFRSDGRIAEEIETITGIPQKCLSDVRVMLDQPVACKMSWAAGRTCEREEDTAYCLLGLFGINIPLLYGEGSGAFQRLQEAIVRQSDDESIFAWNVPTKEKKNYFWRHFISTPSGAFRQADARSFAPFSSAFAPSPDFFEHCGKMERQEFAPRLPYSITNKGLGFDGSFIKLSLPWIGSVYVMELNCVDTSPSDLDGSRSICRSGCDTRSCLIAFEQTPQNPMLLRRIAPVTSDYALWWLLGNYEREGYTMEVIKDEHLTVEIDNARISGPSAPPTQSDQSGYMTIDKFMRDDCFTAGLQSPFADMSAHFVHAQPSQSWVTWETRDL